mgnify:CR=1 FL=1|jgi:hypothetical protein
MALIKTNARSSSALDATILTGNLPAISGASLTGITAETNTPIFFGKLTGTLDVSNGSTRKLQLNSIILDTASAWSGSDYRWTVPSGQAGKYFIEVHIHSVTDTNNAVAWNIAKIAVNGSELDASENKNANNQSNYVHQASVSVSAIRTLAVGDYVEPFGITYGGGTTRFGNSDSSMKIFKVSS